MSAYPHNDPRKETARSRGGTETGPLGGETGPECAHPFASRGSNTLRVKDWSLNYVSRTYCKARVAWRGRSRCVNLVDHVLKRPRAVAYASGPSRGLAEHFVDPAEIVEDESAIPGPVQPNVRFPPSATMENLTILLPCLPRAGSIGTRKDA